MMVPTHVVFGPVLATPLLVEHPDLAVVGALAGIVGGVFPDLDLVVGDHRKTLHYPVAYWIIAVPTVGISTLVPTPVSVGGSLFVLGAAVHASMDTLADDRSFEPGTVSRHGVYSHIEQRWLSPRGLVRYDGAPEDVALTLLLAGPGLFWFGATVAFLTVCAVAVAVAYGLVRSRCPRRLDPTTQRE